MKQVKKGELKTVYRGKIFNIKKQKIIFPNGTEKIFEYCERPSSVTVLAFNEKNELLLIREQRYRRKDKVWFLPAGKMDVKGEGPKKSALRELREETGFGAKTIKLLHQKSPSNTMLWNIYIYVAKDLYRAPLKGDEHFPIEVVPTSLKKAVKMALDGTIENEYIAYAIIRFDYMLRHEQFSW
jgi:8-oxo-dGTP pyrophosphatase MutT (NUDIX family)